MTPIFQRIVDHHRGDCLTAAVASILDLPYEAVPTWVADAYDSGNFHKWHSTFIEWMQSRGFHYLTISFDDLRDWRQLPGCLCIASIKSQKFPDTFHAVVATWEKRTDDGHYFTIIHDPNPTNVVYKEDPRDISFLVPINPAKFKL